MGRLADVKSYFWDIHFAESCLKKTEVVAKIFLVVTLKLYFVHVDGPWK